MSVSYSAPALQPKTQLNAAFSPHKASFFPSVMVSVSARCQPVSAGIPSRHSGTHISQPEDATRSTTVRCTSKGGDISPDYPSRSVSPQFLATDPACLAAARAQTPAEMLEQMVALRRSGLSLRQIGRRMGRCMEGVRQALMRYEAACQDYPATTTIADDPWSDPLRDPEPLPPGHPIAMRGLWRGLEKWRGLA